MIARLPQHLEKRIEYLLDSGKYEDPIDVLSKAVDLLTEQVRSEELDALLAVGREQSERGELLDYSPGLRQEIRESARRRLLADSSAGSGDAT